MRHRKPVREVPHSIPSDLALGVFNGLNDALWAYGFASILFAGVLSAYFPLGLVLVLTGSALLGIWVVMTSRIPVHLAGTDEQAIVILASVISLLPLHMGQADAAGPRGLATALALIVLTSLAVSGGFVLVGRWRLTRLLELLPYPVICGFMAGVGWLLLEAAVRVTTDQDLWTAVTRLPAFDPAGRRLVFTAVCGLALAVFLWRVTRAWALPAAATLITLLFYGVAFVSGQSLPQLMADGWLFDVQGHTGEALAILTSLRPSDIDPAFLLSAIPQVLTIVFLALLSISMSLTTLETVGHVRVDKAWEIGNQGRGNLLCALVVAPPGHTDIAESLLYRTLGVRGRWMPLTAHLICLLAAIFGTYVLGYIPKLLVAATIFVFAFRLLHEWIYANTRGFQLVDFAIVCIILAMVIFVNFMVGIVSGIVLTLLLFVMRYSMISAVQGRYSLCDFRSSVERPVSLNGVLDQYGENTLIYTLRGFLFFGTANSVLERIRKDLGPEASPVTSVVLDFKRVTGVDVSAINSFFQVRNAAEAAGAQLFFSGLRPGMRDEFAALGVFGPGPDYPDIFEDLDHAIEYLEEQVLVRHQPAQSGVGIEAQLTGMLEDAGKAKLLLQAMHQVHCGQGETLFSQGDPDDGFYVLESGSLSAYITNPGHPPLRVKKFGPGALIGEMSGYSADRSRTASVIVDRDAVLYHMPAERMQMLDQSHALLAAAVHELIARTLSSRVSFMNRRLLQETE